MQHVHSFLLYSHIGEGAVLKYLIPDGVLDNKFSLDTDSGELRASVLLDREEQAQYIITGVSII